jgi:hypothetical protein
MSDIEETEDSTAPETAARNRMDLNSIATIGAVILSIVAISISLLEVTTMRTQQRAAVWPYIMITQSYSQGTFAISLQNKGVGPALVKDFSILLDGEPAPDLDKLIAEVVGEEDAFSYDIYRASNPSNGVISPRESVNIFSFPINDVTNVFLQRAANRVEITACYCSIHDQCWETSLTASSASEVKSCK